MSQNSSRPSDGSAKPRPAQSKPRRNASAPAPAARQPHRGESRRPQPDAARDPHHDSGSNSRRDSGSDSRRSASAASARASAAGTGKAVARAPVTKTATTKTAVTRAAVTRSAAANASAAKAQAGRTSGGNLSGAKTVAAERYPQAEFARREGRLDNFPAVMVVNRALKGYPFRRDFPWCVRLAVAYRMDTATGQPLPKEEGLLEAFEQKMFSLFKKTVNGHYVGHTSWGGSREFLFYVDEGGELEEPLQGFAQTQKRELEFAIEKDEKWTQAQHYFDYRE